MNTTLSPIPFLADLREAALARSQKRMPKWKFRLALDLVLELQPKPTFLLLESAIALSKRQRLTQFDGRAVMGECVTVTSLERLPRMDNPRWVRRFEIFTVTPDEWTFRNRGGVWKRGADHEGLKRISERIVETLRGGFFDRLAVSAMLRPQCLICGKGLTDPASIARWIGPECAGTSSLSLPLFWRRAGGQP